MAFGFQLRKSVWSLRIAVTPASTISFGFSRGQSPLALCDLKFVLQVPRDRCGDTILISNAVPYLLWSSGPCLAVDGDLDERAQHLLGENLAVTVKMVGVGEGLPIRSINKADEVAGKCFARNCPIFFELIRKSSFLANDAK